MSTTIAGSQTSSAALRHRTRRHLASKNDQPAGSAHADTEAESAPAATDRCTPACAARQAPQQQDDGRSERRTAPQQANAQLSLGSPVLVTEGHLRRLAVFDSPAGMAHKRRDPDQLRCPFCSKTEPNAKVVTGPNGIGICNECVQLCNDILDEPGSPPGRMEARTEPATAEPPLSLEQRHAISSGCLIVRS